MTFKFVGDNSDVAVCCFGFDKFIFAAWSEE